MNGLDGREDRGGKETAMEETEHHADRASCQCVSNVQCQWNATIRFLALTRSSSENLGHRFVNELTVLSRSRRRIVFVR